MSNEPKTSVTKRDIIKGLNAMGIRKNDVIMVHSSLKSFGHVDGGADAVVDALVETVGPGGLACVPTLSHCYKGEPYFFNRLSTPSRVGLISETLRRRPEAKRSTHPTHSVAGIGSRADELVAVHSTSSHFHRSSPWGKLMSWNAKIVFMGARIGTNTMLHAIEEWAGLPLFSSGHAQVEDEHGNQQLVPVWGIPSGCRDFYKTNSKSERLFRAKNLLAEGCIATSKLCVLISNQIQAAMFRALYTDQPDIYCCESAKCEFCPAKRVACWRLIHGFVPPDVTAHLETAEMARIKESA